MSWYGKKINYPISHIIMHIQDDISKDFQKNSLKVWHGYKKYTPSAFLLSDIKSKSKSPELGQLVLPKSFIFPICQNKKMKDILLTFSKFRVCVFFFHKLFRKFGVLFLLTDQTGFSECRFKLQASRCQNFTGTSSCPATSK